MVNCYLALHHNIATVVWLATNQDRQLSLYAQQLGGVVEEHFSARLSMTFPWLFAQPQILQLCLFCFTCLLVSRLLEERWMLAERSSISSRPG